MYPVLTGWPQWPWCQGLSALKTFSKNQDEEKRYHSEKCPTWKSGTRQTARVTSAMSLPRSEDYFWSMKHPENTSLCTGDISHQMQVHSLPRSSHIFKPKPLAKRFPTPRGDTQAQLTVRSIALFFSPASWLLYIFPCMTLWGQCRNHSLSTPCVWVSPISLITRPYCVPQFTFSEDFHLFLYYRLQLNSGHKLKLNLPKAICSPLIIHPLFTSQPFHHSQTSVLFLDTHMCVHMCGCVPVFKHIHTSVSVLKCVSLWVCKCLWS
jgi:hypothetical protein